jgi:hypothetical protein
VTNGQGIIGSNKFKLVQHQILFTCPLLSIMSPYSVLFPQHPLHISPSLRYFYLPNLMFTQCKLNVIWPKGSNPPWSRSPPVPSNWISTSPRPTTLCSFHITHHFTIYFPPAFILCLFIFTESFISKIIQPK